MSPAGLSFPHSLSGCSHVSYRSTSQNSNLQNNCFYVSVYFSLSTVAGSEVWSQLPACLLLCQLSRSVKQLRAPGATVLGGRSAAGFGCLQACSGDGGLGAGGLDKLTSQDCAAASDAAARGCGSQVYKTAVWGSGENRCFCKLSSHEVTCPSEVYRDEETKPDSGTSSQSPRSRAQV